MIVDEDMAELVEMNPPLSARKFLKHTIPIEEAGGAYGGEGYRTTRELSKAVRSTIKLAENLKRRKQAPMKP